MTQASNNLDKFTELCHSLKAEEIVESSRWQQEVMQEIRTASQESLAGGDFLPFMWKISLATLLLAFCIQGYYKSSNSGVRFLASDIAAFTNVKSYSTLYYLGK